MEFMSDIAICLLNVIKYLLKKIFGIFMRVQSAEVNSLYIYIYSPYINFAKKTKKSMHIRFQNCDNFQ